MTLKIPTWRRGYVLAVVAAVTLGLLAAGVATSYALRGPATVNEGDVVHYHFNAYNENDELVYTTDPKVAEGALADGNPWLDSNLSAEQYGLRFGPIVLEAHTTPESWHQPITPSRYLLGHKEGDTVYTPLIVDALGKRRLYDIPATIGPVKLEFTLDLTTLYNETNREDSLERFGDPSVFQPGNTLPYGDALLATVVEVQGDTARLKVDAEEGGRVHSRALGINFTIERLPGSEDSALLHADLTVGQKFQAEGCELPLEDLSPGDYFVVGREGDSWKVASVLSPRFESVIEKTLRFEIRILKVDKPSLAGKWAGALNLNETHETT